MPEEPETQIIYIAENDSVTEQVENETADSTVDNSIYDIPASLFIESYYIDRAYTEAFTLDGIRVDYFSASKTMSFVNHTPRYLHNPTVRINGSLYRVMATIEPFQVQEFSLLGLELNVASIKFVEEQPMFRIFMKGYFDHLNSDEVGLASAENALQYEQEMRGYKNALNDFDLAVHMSEYLSDYGKATRTFTNYSFEDIDCPHPSHQKSGTDTSPSYTKILSMFTHQPTSIHYLLLKSYNGLATIGNGWLSVRDFRLYQNGQQIPKTTYLHEKHHNHSFGHSGGMTYGIPDVIINYMREGHLDSYYDAEYLAEKIPSTATEMRVEQVDAEHLDLIFSFYSQEEKQLEADGAISRFMFVAPDSIEVTEVAVSENGVDKIISPSLLLAESRAQLFDGTFNVDIKTFGEQETVSQDYVRLRVLRPSKAQTFVVMASGNQAMWARQANVIVGIGGEHGFATSDSQMVFFEQEGQYSDEGVYEENYVKYTPEQAIEYCEAKGLSLGFLPTYKSSEQMEFQMNYLPYKSQVGIDPDSLEPVAVFVDSSYQAAYVNYSDSGELVVCQ